MRRIPLSLLALLLCLLLVACSGATEDSSESVPSSDSVSTAVSDSDSDSDSDSEVAETNSDEPIVETENETETGNEIETENETANEVKTETETDIGNESESDTKILIAYFTWAENTHVDDPDAVDVDATTSASVLPPGNAAKLAGWIQEEVGGDLFSIVVTEPYSSDYDACLDRAADEKAANARPELVNHVENMDDYDVIFVGFPNWWYTVPMAVHSFLEEYDFSGKTVIPFVTHGTGGLASTIPDMTKSLSESTTILDPIGVYRPDVDASQPAIQAWIDGLNLELE